MKTYKHAIVVGASSGIGAELVRQLAAIPGIQDVALTTNGLLLGQHARALKEAGLKRLNISLDAMREKVFREISRRDGLADVARDMGAAMGDVGDLSTFMGAVIDRAAFDKITAYVEQAKRAPGVTVLAGGAADGSQGWFVEPTLLQVEDPGYRTMCEEIFGPVMSVYVYSEAQWRDTLEAAGIDALVEIDDERNAMPGRNPLVGIGVSPATFVYAVSVPAEDRERAVRVLVDHGWDGRYGNRHYDAGPMDTGTIVRRTLLVLAITLAVVIFLAEFA